MDISGLSLLEKFQKQKVSQESEVLQEAQRFVNQYRALHYFDSSFISVFNTQLLSCPPNVRRFFTSIMGGNEVLSYLEFLEKQQLNNVSQNGEEETQTNMVVDGYLPLPESDFVSDSSSSMISVPKDEWLMLKNQQKYLMEQTQTLLRQLKGEPGETSIQERHYSEILDEDN